MKQSAMQICYLRKKKENKPVTKRQLEGVKHQEKVSCSEFKEMRGCLEFREMLIFFSFDEVIVKGDTFILKEHKMVEGEYEDWYEQYSILQTAVYHQAALMQPNKELYTAKFLQKQGVQCNYLNYSDKKLRSILSMGEKVFFEVKPNCVELVHFYVRKAIASQEYETAKEWDRLHKFKEWNQLNKYLTFKRICK